MHALLEFFRPGDRVENLLLPNRLGTVQDPAHDHLYVRIRWDDSVYAPSRTAGMLPENVRLISRPPVPEPEPEKAAPDELAGGVETLIAFADKCRDKAAELITAAEAAEALADALEVMAG